MNILSEKDREVLQQSRPVVFTALINKIGSIGIALIPVLLVERHTTTNQSSVVMGSIRLTLIIGTLSSGWIVDRMGAKFTVLLALLLSSVGLGLLPFAPTAILIAVFGILAQYGDGLMRIAFRVLLTDSVPYHHHKEALGWMRTANNMGQILSYSVGSLAGAWGTIYLFLFDAVTSLGAFFYGVKILPKRQVANSDALAAGIGAAGRASAEKQEHFLVFIICALIFAGYTFFYEIYMSATAGRLELLYPGRGLRLFSVAMVVNTVICTILSVPAARFFNRPSIVFPVGILVSLVAIVFSVGFTEHLPMVYLGSLCISAAEVAMMALTQFTLTRLTPVSKNSTTWYSVGLTLTHSGRIVAASAAFPLFVHPDVQAISFAPLVLAYALVAAFCFSVRRAIDRAAV